MKWVLSIALTFAIDQVLLDANGAEAMRAYDHKLFNSLKVKPAKNYKAEMAHDAAILKTLHQNTVLDTAADGVEEFNQDDSLEQMWKKAQAHQTVTRDRLRREFAEDNLHPAFLNTPSSFIEESSETQPRPSAIQETFKDLHKIGDHISELAEEMKAGKAKYLSGIPKPSSFLETEPETSPETLAPTFLRDPEDRQGFKDMADVQTKLGELRTQLSADQQKFAAPPSSFLQTEGDGAHRFDRLMAISKKLRHIDAGLKHGMHKMSHFHLPSSFLQEVSRSTVGNHLTSTEKLDEMDDALEQMIRDDPNHPDPSSFIEEDSQMGARAFLAEQDRVDRQFRAREHAKERTFEREMSHMKAKTNENNAKADRAFEDITNGEAKKSLDSVADMVSSHADEFGDEAAQWREKLANLRKQK